MRDLVPDQKRLPSLHLSFSVSRRMELGVLGISVVLVVYVVGVLPLNIWVNRRYPESECASILGLFSIPALLVLGVFGSVISVAIIPFVMIYYRIRDYRFAKHMKASGRYMSWSEVEEFSTRGTIIVEQAQKSGCRLWWTEEDVEVTSPHIIPKEEDLDYLRLEDPEPFVSWCYERYISTRSGKASLTQWPNLKYSGFLTTDEVRSFLPMIKAIATVKIG